MIPACVVPNALPPLRIASTSFGVRTSLICLNKNGSDNILPARKAVANKTNGAKGLAAADPPKPKATSLYE